MMLKTPRIERTLLLYLLMAPFDSLTLIAWVYNRNLGFLTPDYSSLWSLPLILHCWTLLQDNSVTSEEGVSPSLTYYKNKRSKETEFPSMWLASIGQALGWISIAYGWKHLYICHSILYWMITLETVDWCINARSFGPLRKAD